MRQYIYFRNGPLEGLRKVESPDDWTPPVMIDQTNGPRVRILAGKPLSAPPEHWRYHLCGSTSIDGLMVAEYLGEDLSQIHN